MWIKSLRRRRAYVGHGTSCSLRRELWTSKNTVSTDRVWSLEGWHDWVRRRWGEGQVDRARDLLVFGGKKAAGQWRKAAGQWM